MTTDMFSIRDLRERAKSLRMQADELDDLANHVERVMSPSSNATEVSQATRRSKVTPRPNSAPPPRSGGGKGKLPGTLSMNWRGNFASIADLAGKDEFSLDIVRDVVRDRTGKEVKPSALRRQFNVDYIKHGYVTSDTADKYRLTDKLLSLVGWQDNGIESRNENEAPNGSAEGASDAEGGATPSDESRNQFRELLG